MEKQNYTIAVRQSVADCFRPLDGAARGLGYLQAQAIAQSYRQAGLDCVAYNLESV